jgi:hypothetical protein
MISLNTTPILTLIASVLVVGSLGCTSADGDNDPNSFERAIAAIDDDTPCNEVELLAQEANERGESAREAVDVDAELCSNCVCDLDDLHDQCEDLPACGKNSKAYAIKGNTCSGKRCDAESPCGGRIICKKGGVECGKLGSDLGTCEWQ